MIKKLLIVLSTLLLLSGCQKVNEATEFDISYSTNLSIPAGGIVPNAPLDIVTPEFPTGSSDRFSSESTTRELIDEVLLSKFTITATSGNLDYIKSISVYVKGEGLNDVLIATKSNIAPGTSSVAADVTGANIKEHLFKEKLRLRASITTNSTITQDQTLKLDQTVRVKGKKIK